jgi:hypothetical protein
MKEVYALIKEFGDMPCGPRYSYQVLGIFESEELAKQALQVQQISAGDDFELVVEEWPLNELKHKFNVRVVASRDGLE